MTNCVRIAVLLQVLLRAPATLTAQAPPLSPVDGRTPPPAKAAPEIPPAKEESFEEKWLSFSNKAIQHENLKGPALPGAVRLAPLVRAAWMHDGWEWPTRTARG